MCFYTVAISLSPAETAATEAAAIATASTTTMLHLVAAATTEAAAIVTTTIELNTTGSKHVNFESFGIPFTPHPFVLYALL